MKRLDFESNRLKVGVKIMGRSNIIATNYLSQGTMVRMTKNINLFVGV